MLGPNDLPFAVTGVRCLVRVDAPKKFSTGGIEIPAEAMLNAFRGKLLDAGLQASDKLFDHGVQLGDTVEFGKFAGVIEEWDHVTEGDATQPDDAYDWKFLDHEPGKPRRYKCTKTGAIRSIEPLIVLNVDDILASTDLAARRRAGKATYALGKTPDGQTQHYIKENV